MCRFIYYNGDPISVGSLVTEPEHSLIHQSYHARERIEPLNGDGFGIAWYQPDVQTQPVVFREIRPAWSSLNLSNLAPVTISGCILAHVRAASPGLPVTQLNCHPFSRGRFAFMHNGEVAGFRQTRRRLLKSLSDESFDHIRGTTDSEIMFGMIMDRIANHDDESPIELMAEALAAAIAETEAAAMTVGCTAPAYLNLVLTDGKRAVISRYVTPGGGDAQSLYHYEGGRYECVGGVCRMVQNGTDGNRTVLVSSEPLSSDPGWSRVQPNSMLLVQDGVLLRTEPIHSARQISAQPKPA